MEKVRVYIEESSPPISDTLYEKIAAHRRLYRKIAFSGKVVRRLRGVISFGDIVTMLRGEGGRLNRFDVMVEVYCDKGAERAIGELFEEVKREFHPQREFIQFPSGVEEIEALKFGLSWESVSFDAWALIERIYSVVEEPFYTNFEFEDDERVVLAVNLLVPERDEGKQFYLVERVAPFKVRYPNGQERLLMKLSSLVEEVTADPLSVSPAFFVIGRGGLWKPLVTVGWVFESGEIYVKIPEWEGREAIEFILDPLSGEVHLLKGDLNLKRKEKEVKDVKLDAVYFIEMGGDELAGGK
ncbi:MAG: hypothetical protein ACTSWP_04165 [Candidatus Freyarchaeota archaeon]|nr:hypothetical protein [Candidatus Freyrarchaeum guaymaensis]